MSELAAARRALRRLLREREPADALAAYYALHHPDNKTNLVLSPPEVAANAIGHADGYVALSRTGIDLFRPLVTLRLPTDRDPAAFDAAVELLQRALPSSQPVILHLPQRYRPLVDALFDVQSEERLRLYALDPARYGPIVNVLVTRATGPGDLPRFTIHTSQSGAEEVAATASLNWLSPHFGEIAVSTRSQFRRQGWGRSVVAALCGYLIDAGRTPLYVVAEDNAASIQLAESVGFVDTGTREYMLQAARK